MTQRARARYVLEGPDVWQDPSDLSNAAPSRGSFSDGPVQTSTQLRCSAPKARHVTRGQIGGCMRDTRAAPWLHLEHDVIPQTYPARTKVTRWNNFPPLPPSGLVQEDGGKSYLPGIASSPGTRDAESKKNDRKDSCCDGTSVHRSSLSRHDRNIDEAIFIWRCVIPLRPDKEESESRVFLCHVIIPASPPRSTAGYEFPQALMARIPCT